jgi:hypothetical protein
MQMKRFPDAASHPLKTGDRDPPGSGLTSGSRDPPGSGLTSGGYGDLPGPCSHPSASVTCPARSDLYVLTVI